MKNQPLSKTSGTFEAIKRVSPAGNESWSARELARVLEYSDFRNFLNVIADARMACTQSGHPVDDHFVEFTDMVEIGSGARRSKENRLLVRTAPMIAPGSGHRGMRTMRGSWSLVSGDIPAIAHRTTRQCGIGHHHRHRHGIQNMSEHEGDRMVSR